MLGLQSVLVTTVVSIALTSASVAEPETGSVDTSRLVFAVAPPETPGFIGGLTGADTVCRETAAAHDLDGVYLAWLGDGAMGPANRFDRDEKPLVNARGDVVSQGWRALGSGEASAPVLQLNGTHPGTEPWSNVNADGTTGPLATTCNRWWSIQAVHAGGTGITETGRDACDSTRPLYCVEQ